MIITVEGSHRQELQPERGTLHLQATAGGTDRAEAMRLVQQRAGELLDRIGELSASPAPTVVEHFVQAPTAWAEQRFDGRGERASDLHHASIQLGVTFSEAQALSDAAAVWGEQEWVQLGHVAWSLTESTREECERDGTTLAIRDAEARAQVMATACGHGAPRLVEVADPGLLNGVVVADSPTGGMLMASARGAHGGVELAPEPIVVHSRVHARFEA